MLMKHDETCLRVHVAYRQLEHSLEQLFVQWIDGNSQRKLMFAEVMRNFAIEEFDPYQFNEEEDEEWRLALSRRAAEALVIQGGKNVESAMRHLQLALAIDQSFFDGIVEEMKDPLNVSLKFRKEIALRMRGLRDIPYCQKRQRFKLKRNFEKWVEEEHDLMKKQLHDVQSKIDELLKIQVQNELKQMPPSQRISSYLFAREGKLQSRILNKYETKDERSKNKEDDAAFLDHHFSLQQLMKYLIVHDNKSVNEYIGFDLDKDILIRNPAIKPLSDMSLYILSTCATLSYVPIYFLNLCYLEILVKNPGKSVEYFECVSTISLYLDRDASEMWFIPEKSTFSHFVMAAFQWCRFLVSTFCLSFSPSPKDVEVLTACLVSLNDLFIILAKYEYLLQIPILIDGVLVFFLDFNVFLEKELESAIKLRYNELVSQSKADSKMEQLKRLIDLVNIEIETHNSCFSTAFSNLCTFAFDRCEIQSFFNFLSKDIASALEELKSETEYLKSTDPEKYIFSLYKSLRTFLDKLDAYDHNCVEMLQKNFYYYIDNWIKNQRKEYPLRLKRALEFDKEVSGSHRSSSVFDMISLLYPMTEVFKETPFNLEHALEFAKLISEIIIKYVDHIRSDILEYMDSQIKLSSRSKLWSFHSAKENNPLGMELPSKILTSFNNIVTARIKLRDMLVHVNIEKFAENESDRNVNSFKLIDSVNESSDKENWNGYGNINEILHCSNTFQHIEHSLLEISRKITEGMRKFWRTSISDFIWKEPVMQIYSSDEVDIALESFWNHIISLIDYIGSNLFVDQSILQVIAEAITEELEMILLPSSLNAVLQPSQLLRIESINSLLLEILVCYGLSKNIVQENDFWKRFSYILQIEKGSTEELCKHWKAVEEHPASFSEEMRKQNPPYLTKEHFIRIIKWRKKNQNDQKAIEFISKSLGVFEALAL